MKIERMIKPYYQEKDIRIYCGDCLEIMPELEAPVNMTLADLPYGTTECKWDNIVNLNLLFSAYKRICSNIAAIVLFASQPFTTDLINAGRDLFKYELIWNKVKPGGFVSAKLKPLKQHENIIVFSKGATANGSQRNMKYYPQMRKAKDNNIRPINKGSSLSKAVLNKRKSMIIAKSDKDYNPELRYPYSILQYSSQVGECNNLNRLHPTQKPIALFEYLIRTYTNEGDIVLDNVMGSGTTLVAAKQLGRKSIGIEIEEKYCEIAVKRLAQEPLNFNAV